MLVSLPEQLETAIDAALRELPSSQWKKAAQSISQRYRTRRNGTEAPIVQRSNEALGYVALILPAAYAQLLGAMKALQARIPQWQPTSMLDIGSGPGTALWAAVEQWPSLQLLTAWEREPTFIHLGHRFATISGKQALCATQWKRVDLRDHFPVHSDTYDLVVFGHMLNELPEATRKRLVEMAWEHCRGVLLIVEPGTSDAFPVVKSMREHLRHLGAHTLAPCVHNNECSLLNDWCHFPQRLKRPRFQRQAKGAPAGWEESKFSYTAMARFIPQHTAWGRLIHQPHTQKGFVELTVSSQDGLVQARILKRDHTQYRKFLSYKWGDVLVLPPFSQEEQ